MSKRKRKGDLRRYIAVLLVIAAMFCSLMGCTVAEGKPDEGAGSEAAGVVSNEPTEPEEIFGTEDTAELEDSEAEDSLAEDSTELEPDGDLSEELWRDAYAAFLRNPEYYDEFEREFTLYDMDRDGIPELFTHSYMCSYTNNEIVVELLHSRRVYAPNDKDMLGVFIEQGPGARMLGISYCKIANDQLYIEGIYTPAMYGEAEIISNSDLYTELGKSDPLPYYEINEANIQRYIYGQTDLVGNTEILSGLPYVGVGNSTISMSNEQALEFIRVIEEAEAFAKKAESNPEYENADADVNVHVAFAADSSGTPVMFILVMVDSPYFSSIAGYEADGVYKSFSGFWGWNGSTTEKKVVDMPNVRIYNIDGSLILTADDDQGAGAQNQYVYEVKDGQIINVDSYNHYNLSYDSIVLGWSQDQGYLNLIGNWDTSANVLSILSAYIS